MKWFKLIFFILALIALVIAIHHANTNNIGECVIWATAALANIMYYNKWSVIEYFDEKLSNNSK